MFLRAHSQEKSNKRTARLEKGEQKNHALTNLMLKFKALTQESKNFDQFVENAQQNDYSHVTPDKLQMHSLR